MENWRDTSETFELEHESFEQRTSHPLILRCHLLKLELKSSMPRSSLFTLGRYLSLVIPLAHLAHALQAGLPCYGVAKPPQARPGRWPSRGQLHGGEVETSLAVR